MKTKWKILVAEDNPEMFKIVETVRKERDLQLDKVWRVKDYVSKPIVLSTRPIFITSIVELSKLNSFSWE